MVEQVGRFEVDHFGPVSWSGAEMTVATMLPGAVLWGDRVASVVATHRVGDTLAVRSTCRPTLDGLYVLTAAVDVDDQGAGAAVVAEQPSPSIARWRLRRLRTAVHQTQVSAVERVSAVAWSVAKKATFGVPGTYVQSDAGLGSPGAVNTGNGLLTIVQSRVGGMIEWVVDPHRFYEGAATIYSIWGGAAEVEANRIPVPGHHAPMGADVVVGNSIVEVWIQTDNQELKLRRWTGPAIGGAWTDWHDIHVYGATQDVRAWTISRNDPDRVAITAERVAGLARGGRLTLAVHRGSRHVELTVSGEQYSLLFDDNQTSSSTSGGIVWARKSGDGVWVMTDADGGLDTLDTTPLWCYATGLTDDHARYGLTLDPPGAGEGIEGVDEWAIFGDQVSRSAWGEQQ